MKSREISVGFTIVPTSNYKAKPKKKMNSTDKNSARNTLSLSYICDAVANVVQMYTFMNKKNPNGILWSKACACVL